MKTNQNQIILENAPITLRRKGPGQVWTARINLPASSNDGGRIEKSTKTKDATAAVAAAHRIYGKYLGKVERGESPTSPKFHNAVKQFLSDCEGRAEAGDEDMKPWRVDRIRTTLERHYVPFFHRQDGGKVIDTDVGSVTATKMDEHALWRKTKHSEEQDYTVTYCRGGKDIQSRCKAVPPSVGTLKKERQDFVAFWKFCQKRGWVSDIGSLQLGRLKGASGRRRAFSKAEMQHLQKVSIEKILETDHPLHRYRRWQLHLRMMWIYLTGCRPQEIAKLQDKDFLDPYKEPDVKGDDSVHIELKEHHLKHPRHIRTVVPLPYFDDVYSVSRLEGFSPNREDYVFMNPDGTLTKNYDNAFRRLLIAADINGGDTTGYSLYSLRHTFITERLEEGMEIGMLSRWCGTSVSMIERHYSHLDSKREMTPKKEGEVEPYNPVYVKIPDAARHGLDKLFDDDDPRWSP